MDALVLAFACARVNGLAFSIDFLRHITTIIDPLPSFAFPPLPFDHFCLMPPLTLASYCPSRDIV